MPYTTKVINGTAMQLTHPCNNITVDFYPEAYIADEGVKRYIQKTSFASTSECSQPMVSYRVVTKTTFKHEVESRIALGYEVTDFNTEKFNDYATYTPLAC